MLKPLVVIVGPTAVGKTELGIRVAQKTQGEIISGDSMQVYRGMDIGTAKVTEQEMQGIPHHMIDIMEPDHEFSVAVFREMAEATIADIHSRGKLPIIVGGTGLYIRSLLDPYDFTPVGSDREYREELHRLAAEKGNRFLHNELAKIDPQTAQRLHPNDLRRVIRALEVFRATQRPISHYQHLGQSGAEKFDLLMFGLNMERGILYQRINQRVERMISLGLVEEVRRLLEKGYSRDLVSMQGLGYKEMAAYLAGEYSLDEAVEVLKRNTRRFAKRQLTWFRRDKRIKWFAVEKYNSMTEIANEIIQYIEGQFFSLVE